MLVVIDEIWDGAEVVLVGQVKLSLGGGADVVMPTASSRLPNEAKPTGGWLSVAFFLVFVSIVCSRVWITVDYDKVGRMEVTR